MLDIIRIEIADVNFLIKCDNLILLKDYAPSYKTFLKSDKNSIAGDINISIKANTIPGTGGMTKIFESGQSWSMFQNVNDYFVVMNSPAFNQKQIWAAQFDQNVTSVDVFLGEMLLEKSNGKVTIPNLISYPLDQILLMYFLAQRQGMLIHAAGLDINGKGYIFPGKSGAGKSTLSKEFVLRNNSEVLSDDRMIIRKMNNIFKTFGTPWPGEEGIAINKSVPLSGIFFISHGSDNKIKEIDKREALERLLPVTSIPWYDQEIMTKILNFCEDVISNIPAYELYFKPGAEVVDVFEKFISE